MNENTNIEVGMKVRWYDPNGKRFVWGSERFTVKTGIVKAVSRQGNEIVIIEWDDHSSYPITRENVDDLIEVIEEEQETV